MATAPYDTLETVLNATRTRIQDAIVTVGGQILTDTADITPVMVNAAWRVLQNKLRAIGFTGFARLKDDLIIFAIPPSASTDIAAQNYISWSGFFDGATIHAGVVLPQEFISPLVAWERPNQAANALSMSQPFRLMDQTLNGLPTNGPLQSRNLSWDWRNDVFAVPGSTIIWDLRLRCLTYQPDFPVVDGVLVTSTLVPIVDCLDPFSCLIAIEFCGPRGDLDVKSFEQRADDGIAALYSRDTAQPTAIRKPAEYGQMRNSYTPSLAPAVAPQVPAAPGGQQ